jgi:hypothetical protein
MYEIISTVSNAGLCAESSFIHRIAILEIWFSLISGAIHFYITKSELIELNEQNVYRVYRASCLFIVVAHFAFVWPLEETQ